MQIVSQSDQYLAQLLETYESNAQKIKSPSIISGAFYPRTRLTLEQKVKLIEESMFPDFDPAEARERYKIGRTCFFSILRNQKEIMKDADTLVSIGNVKSKRLTKYKDMEEKLYKWIVEQNVSGIPVSSHMICTKANLIYPGFKAGIKSKWIFRFRDRYNVVFNKDTKSFIAVKKDK